MKFVSKNQYSYGKVYIMCVHPLKLSPRMSVKCTRSYRSDLSTRGRFLWHFEVGNFDKKLHFSAIMYIFSPLGGDRATFQDSSES